MWRRPSDPDSALTPREAEVLALLREGHSREEMALRLEIGPAAVGYHLSQIEAKQRTSPAAAPGGVSQADKPGSVGRPVIPRRSLLFRLAPMRLRLTPLRAVLLTVVILIVGLYVWGVFLSGDASDDGSIEVEWLFADPPPADFDEQPHPYAGSGLAPGEDMWRAYVIEGSRAPRLVMETNRFPQGTSWSQDGSLLLFSVFSQTTRGEPVNGRVAVDAATGNQVWEKIGPLSGLRSMFGGAGERTVLVDGVNPMQSNLYVVESNGTSRRLSGAWQFASPLSWSADGKHLLLNVVQQGTFARSNPGFGVDSGFYVVSPYETKAVPAGRFRFPPSWSPEGNKIAGFRDGGLVILDLDRRLETHVELPGAVSSISAGQGISFPVWTPDGRYVTFRGAVIDADSGELLTEPDSRTAYTSASPDGRWVAMSSDGAGCPGQALGTPLTANRTIAKEIETGRTLTLLDCDDGAFTFHQWLSADSLLIGGGSCRDCERPSFSLLLATLPDGGLRQLDDGSEQRGFGFAVSRDGQRILLGGQSLRVYSADGALLRSIAAPEGLLVSSVAFSPDSSSIVYVVGPQVESIFPRNQTTPGR
jgi:hypothetical protein